MKFKKFLIWFSILGLLAVGLIMVYSSTNIQEKQFFIRQLLWTIICFSIFAYLKNFDLNFYLKYIDIFYGLGIILLISVLIFGRRIQGAKSWFNFGFISFQPSELFKLVFIITIAKFFVSGITQSSKLTIFIKVFFYILIPIFIIYLQPDIGSIIIYLLILFALFYIRFLNEKYLLPILFFLIFCAIFLIRIVILKNHLSINNFLNEQTMFFINSFNIIAIIIGITLITILFLRNIFKFKTIIITTTLFILLTFAANTIAYITYKQLKHYQIQRIIAFLNPYSDPLDYGYNTIQSLIAIGSGGIFGKGLMQGTQSRLGFLPERRTDFILSVICEETGFAGIMFILILFFILLLNMILCIYKIQNQIAQFICLGVFFMIFFELFINASVALDLIPVMGIPLPFISYGGSSLLKFTFSFAIVYNIFKKI